MSVRAKVVLSLVLIALMGCGTLEVRDVADVEQGGTEVELEPVWVFYKNGTPYMVYEFTDLDRLQHCYVVVKQGEYYSGIGLTCESLGDR